MSKTELAKILAAAIAAKIEADAACCNKKNSTAGEYLIKFTECFDVSYYSLESWHENDPL